MNSPELAQLIARAEQLSPERHPDQAVQLNRQIVQLDPDNAAAYLRLARAFQTQRQFASATAACREALQRQPQSAIARKRWQRITEEWALAQQAETIASYDEAFRSGIAARDEERIAEAIACLWRAVELSPTARHAILCYHKLAAIYRSRKDLASLDRAARLYEWVLRQAPGNVTARRGLSAVLREQQARKREGERELRRARQRAQHQPRQERRRAGHQWRPTDQPIKQPATLAEALQVLNLRPPVSRAAIKRAYRAQARVVHPDLGGSHAAMVRLNAAYELALASV